MASPSSSDQVSSSVPPISFSSSSSSSDPFPLFHSNPPFISIPPSPSPLVIATASPHPTPRPPRLTIPSTCNYGGNHGFRLALESTNCNQEKKSSSWTFSVGLNRIYCKIGAAVPIKFRCSSPPPPGSLIRAIVVYSDPQHVQDVVTRCPTHAKGESFHPLHVLRADHPHARYVDADAVFGRHAVTVPWTEPQLGMEETQYNFKFMCLSTCAGGIHRRSTQIIFTLESAVESDILARASTGFRVCACPGRDRKKDEAAAKVSAGGEREQQSEGGSEDDKKKRKRGFESAVDFRHCKISSSHPSTSATSYPSNIPSSAVVSQPIQPNASSSSSVFPSSSSSIFPSSSSSSSSIFTISTRHWTDYEVLFRVKMGLELARASTDETKREVVLKTAAEVSHAIDEGGRGGGGGGAAAGASRRIGNGSSSKSLAIASANQTVKQSSPRMHSLNAAARDQEAPAGGQSVLSGLTSVFAASTQHPVSGDSSSLVCDSFMMSDMITTSMPQSMQQQQQQQHPISQEQNFVPSTSSNGGYFLFSDYITLNEDGSSHIQQQQQQQQQPSMGHSQQQDHLRGRQNPFDPLVIAEAPEYLSVFDSTSSTSVCSEGEVVMTSRRRELESAEEKSKVKCPDDLLSKTKSEVADVQFQVSAIPAEMSRQILRSHVIKESADTTTTTLTSAARISPVIMTTTTTRRKRRLLSEATCRNMFTSASSSEGEKEKIPASSQISPEIETTSKDSRPMQIQTKPAETHFDENESASAADTKPASAYSADFIDVTTVDEMVILDDEEDAMIEDERWSSLREGQEEKSSLSILNVTNTADDEENVKDAVVDSMRQLLFEPLEMEASEASEADADAAGSLLMLRDTISRKRR